MCAEYQENTTKLQRSANLSDEEKSVCVKLHQEHLDKAKSERENAIGTRKACEEAKDNFASFQQEFDFTETTCNSCSLEKTMHYSFDYAQQVHIYRAIQCSLAQSTSRRHGNAEYSVFHLKLFPGK